MDNTKIAGNLTIQDWNDLLSKLDVAKDDNWGKAFDFFEQRIITRYINPIHHILTMGLNTGEGFAVVNIQCSLIETIECFYNGWINIKGFYYERDKKTLVKEARVFESFFRRWEPFKTVNIPASFYFDVRCGLLHEIQTKHGWIIREKKKEKVPYEEDKDGNKIIYRSNFQTAIEKVIQLYQEEIVYGQSVNTKEIRENFIAKFNHICSES